MLSSPRVLACFCMPPYVGACVCMLCLDRAGAGCVWAVVFTNTGTVGNAFSNCFDRGSILTSTVFDDFLESANDGGTVTYLWVPVRVILIPGQWVSTFQYCTVQYCSSDLQYSTVLYCTDLQYCTVLYSTVL